MITVKYRLARAKLNPRRTRLDIPGWAGQPEKRADGAHEYPWHCIPFSEAARSGIELCYPHDVPMHVSVREGVFNFATQPETTHAGDGEAPPFRGFGRHYYTYQLLLDLKVPPGLAIKTEPHPRFFTDATGTVPIAVPAILRHWWPMIYFVVFKAPAAGQTHIFHPGEPFLQITLVRPDEVINLVEMPEEEAAERELQSRRIHASRDAVGRNAVDVRYPHGFRRHLPPHSRRRTHRQRRLICLSDRECG
jgi:hypothetical protein